MAKCGAKKRSDGEACNSPAMANGRCRLHGGKTGGGAPKGNKNNVKAGSIYSKYLTDEENEFVVGVDVDDLRDEIRLAKLQVARIQKEIQATKGGVDLELDSGQVVERSGDKTTTKVMRRRDLHGILDRALGRVASLMLTYKQLIGEAGEDDVALPTTIVYNVKPAVGDVRITIGKKQDGFK